MTQISELAVGLYSTLVSKMPQLPDDPHQRALWRQTLVEELETATAIVGDRVAVRLAAEIAEAEFLSTFHGHEGEEKPARCIRYVTLLDAVSGGPRLWLPVLNDTGSRITSVEEAQALWRKHGPDDISLYHAGFLKKDYGMELYRSPMLTHESGRGLRVAQQARGCIGERVLIYKMKESYRSTDFKVVARIQRLPAGIGSDPAMGGDPPLPLPNDKTALDNTTATPQAAPDDRVAARASSSAAETLATSAAPPLGGFASFADLRAAANAEGIPSQAVMDAYRDASKVADCPKAFAVAWRELTTPDAAAA